MHRRYRIAASDFSTSTASQTGSLKLTISSVAVVRLLSLMGLGLIVASSIGKIYQQLVSRERYEYLIDLFYVDAEKNFPTAYSFLMLLICSILLIIIASVQNQRRDRYTKHWRVLSILFFLLAIDEFCSVHELTTYFARRIFNTSGIFYFAWVIPAIAFISIFILIYLKFVLSLPGNTKLGFILSGTIFILGSIGMELIGGYFYELYGSINSTYMIVATFEEMLEMSGIIIFIYTLLEYLKPRLKCLNISIID